MSSAICFNLDQSKILSSGNGLNILTDVRNASLHASNIYMYSITCIQRPLKGSNESGLFHQVVFKCRFYWVDFRKVVVSEQWSLKVGGLLIQVVFNTGLTVPLIVDFTHYEALGN